jgi:hypothetical protein
LKGGVAVPRIEVDARVYRELELVALAWNTTVGDAVACLVDDLSRPRTDHADGAPVGLRQEGNRNP